MQRSYVVQSARVPFAGLPRAGGVAAGAVSVPAQAVVERSVLESGVRVASVDVPAALCTLSLIVDAGTRYEDRQTAGAASFLAHLAYKVPPSPCPRPPVSAPLARGAGCAAVPGPTR